MEPGAIQQEELSSTLLSIQPSGPVQVDGIHSYRIYAGFGMVPLSQSGMQIGPGEEFILAHIPLSGIGGAELVNNDWTAQEEHNGDYYLSIGGEDRTGSIYGISTSVSDIGLDPDLTVLPNPTTGPFEVVFQGMANNTYSVRITNALGELIMTRPLPAGQPTHRHRMDFSGQAAGVYQLEVFDGRNTMVQRVVLH